MRTSADLISTVLGTAAPRPAAPAGGGADPVPPPAEAGPRRRGGEYVKATVNLPAGLMPRLRVAAAEESTSVSAVLTRLAEEWLDSRG